MIKEGEGLLRNSLWTGNPMEKKAITVSWDKCCKPVQEGGLGIRKLGDLNLAMLTKLAWQIMTGNSSFSKVHEKQVPN
ncbi:hypothetical protein FRX31_009452 [Thalictrum thalictroides]|uniref:Uncharacterized protein n=1 Tax=Thalictrum thalictroides TaxID=46969 RepID=A0A7J6WWM2_THATH|nr:hypothetical protein FRX31_009452 [Thalictrum thalictroides]